MERTRRNAWVSWASVSLLTILCGVVAVLQYQWIGAISGADRKRLQEQLQDSLNSLRRGFNDELTAACAGLQPAPALIDRSGRAAAYGLQYSQWKATHAPMFRRIALAVPEDDGIAFYELDLDLGRVSPGDWPADWSGMRDRLLARRTGMPMPPATNFDLLEMPRFTQDPDRGTREQEWLILQLDLNYFRATTIPGLLSRYLGSDGKLDYDAEVIAGQAAPTVIYASGGNRQIGASADATVSLFDGGGLGFGPGQGRGPGPGPPPGSGFRGGPPGRFTPRPQPGGPGWLLRVRHKAGSLEALVQQARRRNLAVSAGLLLLIVATVVMLVRFSRQAQRLAELQINFVAGVSHELRTPLTVIRTAAFNLRGKLAQKPDQVERYGALIQDESEKLAALVEQILAFARSKAGLTIQKRTPVVVAGLIEQSLRQSQAAAQASGLVVEKHIPADLPCILADELAMRHAMQNLIENALKYGTEGSNWVGIFASVVTDGNTPAVEIVVADRGPGIPHDEQQHIFDAFFRGRRALQDQIHGTGLGLDIVKKIVEAHGGSIHLRSTPGKTTEFAIRIPTQ